MSSAQIPPRRPVISIILDGFGVNPSKLNNAVAQASTPNLDHFFSCNNHTLLQASGKAVGLPNGQMGNSEVGHLTLGSGEIIRQNLVLIDEAIRSGEFFNNPALIVAVEKAATADRPLHLFGLVSDGGVHSHMNHLSALIKLCHQRNVKPILHMVADGRDTSQHSALQFIKQIEPALHAAGGAIASIIGRYYAMDRDNRWQRTELAWKALCLGEGRRCRSARQAIESAYAMGECDEFIKPAILAGAHTIQPEDQLISFNFRKDRAKQMIEALSSDHFTAFERDQQATADVTCMMSYHDSFNLPVAFTADRPATTLAEIISNAGIKQFHCAETEKYAHVTYFFNGGRGEPHQGEVHHVVPSPDVATYDLKPEMSADQVADSTINAINSSEYGFIVVNFANGDMVGHSAQFKAAVKAVEALDREVGRVMKAAVTAGFSVIVTADHGNCEEMQDPISGAPHTQHTAYPVPCLIMDEQHWQLANDGGLSNIAPTVLQLMGLVQPPAMRADSLLIKAIALQPDYLEMVGAA